MIFVPLVTDKVEAALQMVTLRCGLREVRKLNADEWDDDGEEKRAERKPKTSRKSRAKRK